MNNTNTYYDELWNSPNKPGYEFYKVVNHDHVVYKYQENMFTDYILKNLSNINSVLELGAGTGRMSKIVMDIFPNIFRYDTVDITFKPELTKTFSNFKGGSNTHFQFDITSDRFHRWFAGKKYDLVLASEVFMHIRPEHINNLITTLSNITKHIINIDWYVMPPAVPVNSDWCFIHDYIGMYTKNGLTKVDIIDMSHIIQQCIFHYKN